MFGNELLWLVMMAVNFFAVMFLYRLWGRIGLFCWIPLSVMMANVQVVKLVDLFGVTATLGNIVYATGFLVTDILSENHGKKDANNAVWIGFFSLIVMTAIMSLAVAFQPNAEDWAQPHLKEIFTVLPRLAFGSLVAYGVSQFHDVWAFHFWRRVTGDKHLWLRNNASTFVSQLIDSLVFTTIAFLGTVPAAVFWELVLTTYLFKFIVAACDTPFVYWARRMKRAGRAGLLLGAASEGEDR